MEFHGNRILLIYVQEYHKRNRESKYSDVNEALHAWFCLAVSKMFIQMVGS